MLIQRIPTRKRIYYQGIAESLGYKSESDIYLHEYVKKEGASTNDIAKLIHATQNTARTRIKKCGFKLKGRCGCNHKKHEQGPVYFCGNCGFRPCTPPRKNLCDTCWRKG